MRCISPAVTDRRSERAGAERGRREQEGIEGAGKSKWSSKGLKKRGAGRGDRGQRARYIFNETEGWAPRGE